MRLHAGILRPADRYRNAIRALSPAAWFRPGVGVTGTLTASNWADQSGNGRDLAQASAGNQPIYLPYSGTPYAYLPGVAGNYFSTPDSAANSITGDIDIRVKVALDDWTPTANNVLVSKVNTNGQSSYDLTVNITTGRLNFRYTTDGTWASLKSATSSAAPTVSDAATIWVRATYANSTGKVNFYQSDDGSTWTAVGTEQTITSGTIFDGSDSLFVGAQLTGGTSGPTFGKIYRAQIYNGINGTLAVDFSPSDFAETSTNGTTATASTGEVWTLNSTGAYPATIVKSPQLLFGGVDEYMKASAFTLNQPETIYVVFKQVSWTNNDHVFDGNAAASGAFYQNIGSPALYMYAGTDAGGTSALAVGTFGIATVLFNGASSLAYINSTLAISGDASSNNMGGLTLGSNGAAANFGNIIVKELLVFAAAHDAATRALVRNYNSIWHGISLS